MTDRDELIRALRLLFVVGDVFEIRVLKAVTAGYQRPHTESGYFDYEHIPQAADAIAKLRSYAGAYVTLNPVDPDLLARACNRIGPAEQNSTTADADTVVRRWLPVDCDAVRKSNISSTDDEHETALSLARDIRKGLVGLGWPEPVMLDSGNGAQMLFRIDLPAKDDGLVQKAIASIAEASTEKVHVDLTVYNPARIWRLPGTMNCKGDSIPTRPHRMAHIISAPDTPECVSDELLRKVIACSSQANSAEIHQDCAIDSTFSLDAWIAEHLPELGSPVPYNGGRKWVFRVCPFNHEHDNGSAVLIEEPSGAIAFRCLHNSCAGNDWPKLREMLEPGCYDRPQEHPDVDLSGLLGKMGRSTICSENTDNSTKCSAADATQNAITVQNSAADTTQNPSVEDMAPDISEEELRETLIETLPFPEHLYGIPGLVGKVMATTLEYSSSPNRPLALSGALALMSYLAARKVKTPTGLRSNVYLLALAISGSGKERPRDINQIIIEEVGLGLGLLDGVASGAGLEDMLMVSPALFWQCDEFYSTMDEMLREGKEGNNTIMEKLLKMYTTSHKSYSTRAKSGKQPVSIPNPNLTLYATTTPKGFFDHVNERFLADGMYARLNLMVAEKPEMGHLPLEPRVPQDVIEQARLWALFKPEGSGNMGPKAMLAPYTADAEPLAEALFRKQQERLQEMHRTNAPEWKCSVWNRYCETALRYALIYACSVAPRPELTVITPDALRWGGAFVEWEMENKFYMTDRNYFRTDFSKLQDIALTGIRNWHKENGLKVPMPGWKFNRLLDGQPPNVRKAVTEALLDQEKLFAQRAGRGWKYSLKRFGA